MDRKHLNSRASARLVAWLIVGQMLPWGSTAALASEPAAYRRFDLRPPLAANPAPLPTPPTDLRPSNESVLPPSSVRSTAEQQDLGAVLADYVTKQEALDADLAWTADTSSLASGEKSPAGEDKDASGEKSPPKKDTDRQQKDNQKNQTGKRGNRLDPDLVRQGQNFFEAGCTACHDAARATSKRKSLAGWLATVRRMAAKQTADIPASQHTAIATYLTSLNPAYTEAEKGKEGGKRDDAEAGAKAELAAAEADVPPFTLNGTLSPVWRGTDREVEYKGFFPDTWVGVEWRPPKSPVSGKVTACASCHGTNNGLGVELVEAAATLDLCHLLTGKPREERSQCRTTAELTMGRFIVPFGAFSGRVHPGALRTVSLPLMYNMGRRVGPIGPGQPVINQPYSDEGADLHLKYDLDRDWDVTFDSYAVNGLQTGGPGVFFDSRSYQDNNSNVAVGGRATIGNERWRFGGSITGGELEPDGAPLQPYSIAGGDVSYRHKDLFRAYYEYAIRQEDSFPSPNSESLAFGNLIEAEVGLLSDPKISFLARFDTLEHVGALGHDSTKRFTYGLNWVLRGGSLLIVDQEHWIFNNTWHANIVGLRWTVAF